MLLSANNRPGPLLLNYRAEARTRLFDFYQPFGEQMGVDETLRRLFADPAGLQRRYEALGAVGPTAAGRYPYPTVSCDDHCYPEPVEYLRVEAMRDKVYQIFQDPVHLMIFRDVCRRCGLNDAAYDERFDELVHRTVTLLMSSHERCVGDRRPTNDLERFLQTWKDGYASSDPRAASHDLIHNTSYNTARRMRTERRRADSNRDEELATIATVGAVARSTVAGVDTILADPILTADQRAVIRMRIAGRCTFREIAAVRGEPYLRVRQLFHSGLANLRAKYIPGTTTL